MKESLYLKMAREIKTREAFQIEKENYLKEMQKNPVGLCRQSPSGEDLRSIAGDHIAEFFARGSDYARYLIKLAALEAAVDSLKKATGTSGFLEEIYLPVTIVSEGKADQDFTLEKELLEAGLTGAQMAKQIKAQYCLAEPYEIETELEGEINRMVEKSMYCPVLVGGKLEWTAELAVGKHVQYCGERSRNVF